MKIIKYIQRVLVWGIIDVVLVNLSIVLAFYIRFLGPPPSYNFNAYRFMTLYVTILPFCIFFLTGIYKSELRFLPREQVIEKIFTGILLLFFCFSIVIFIHRESIGSFPAFVLILAVIISFSLITITRFIFWSKTQYPVYKKNKLIFLGLPSASIIKRVKNNRFPSYEIVGYIGDKKNNSKTFIKYLGEIKDISCLLEKLSPDEVFVNTEDFSPHQIEYLLTLLEDKNCTYRLIPSYVTILTGQENIFIKNNIPLIKIKDPSIEGWNQFFKRIIDITLGSILFIITFPILFIACIAIVIDSKGWPIFTQKRVGKNGKLFNIYKLRTMYLDRYLDGPNLTQDNDPRITRVGKWLRKTSIDELPQLINVIKGEMSLVGPRAVIPEVVDKFTELEKFALNVKPGITGLAQICGRDEVSFRDKSILNLYYITRYSIFLDFKIMYKTIAIILSQTGTGGTRIEG